jgi:hypothetical protein
MRISTSNTCDHDRGCCCRAQLGKKLCLLFHAQSLKAGINKNEEGKIGDSSQFRLFSQLGEKYVCITVSVV